MSDDDDRHGWTHVICLDCYQKEQPDRDTKNVAATGTGEPCCWCGKPGGVRPAAMDPDAVEAPGVIYYRAKTPPKCSDLEGDE